MNVILPSRVVHQMTEALRRGGRREIGGILMGEHVGLNAFRVRELTVQYHGGTFASFVRIVAEIVTPLRRFFERTKHDYERFNYLGEWHSHHSFDLVPSGCDERTMLDIVSDPDVGALFAVLLLAKLGAGEKLLCSVTFFSLEAAPQAGSVILEAEGH